MIENTVFVVGAGASQEANLPTGNELKSKIAQLLDMRFDRGGSLEHGDHIIVSALRKHVRHPDGSNGDINPYLHEARHIKEALPLSISIDNFIDAHRDNDKIALCGKLAIVRSILDAENKSLLFFERSRMDSNIKFRSIDETWYIQFFKLVTENCSKNDIKERFKALTLIVFNYDRCIEHFIYCALQKYYKLSDTDSAELIKNINIYHPYGDVGVLPWVDKNGAIEFGAEPNTKQLLELSQKIKTFTEGTNPDSSEIVEIRKHMGIANKVVFLGFAFHKLNMQLIAPENIGHKRSSVKIFATTYNISGSDIKIIDTQIRNLYPYIDLIYDPDPHSILINFASLTCGKFFKEHWIGLSF